MPVALDTHICISFMFFPLCLLFSPLFFRFSYYFSCKGSPPEARRVFFFLFLQKAGLFRKEHWKAAADCRVIKDLGMQGFSSCIFFQNPFGASNGLLALSEGRYWVQVYRTAIWPWTYFSPVKIGRVLKKKKRLFDFSAFPYQCIVSVDRQFSVMPIVISVNKPIV